MAHPPRLALSQVGSGLLGRNFEDLRWYFLESDAAQSGLKSSQSGFEKKMLAGVSLPPAEHHFDGRLLANVYRAKKIQARLATLGKHHLRVLRSYFTRVQPLIDKLPADRQGKKMVAKLMRGVEPELSFAMRAYAGSEP